MPMKKLLNNIAQQVIEYLLLCAVVIAGIVYFVGSSGPFRPAVEQSISLSAENPFRQGADSLPTPIPTSLGDCNNDGDCDPPLENTANCPIDCPPETCRNGKIDPGETCHNCPDDVGECCGTGGPSPTCDDGTSGPDYGENCFNCKSDCGSCCGPASYSSKCDNGKDDTEDYNEKCNNCPEDCGACCGDPSDPLRPNITCQPQFGENCYTCPGDCGVTGAPAGNECCGDGVCNYGETCVWAGAVRGCSADCGGDCCGNGTCEDEYGETCETCPLDCGGCGCGDKVCTASAGENCSICPQDCGACCGNGSCDDGQGGRPDYNEDCAACWKDCGWCTWITLSWGFCSPGCNETGAGTSTPALECRRDGGAPVAFSYCDPGTQPQPVDCPVPICTPTPTPTPTPTNTPTPTPTPTNTPSPTP